MPKGDKSRENGKKGGRPVGSVYSPEKALAKAAIRELVRAMVSEHLVPMTEAQIANAKGLKYLVKRDKAGKFQRIGPEGVTGDPDEVIEVWEKDPSTPAFTDLLNRAADKPIEAVEVEHRGGLVITHEIGLASEPPSS